MSDKSLTPKQEKFCLEYLKTGNASEAYRLSYDAKKMKPETINRKAKELMDNGKIAARLRAMVEKAGLIAEETLKEVARLSYADVRKLFREDGSLKEIHELDGDTAAAVASFEVDEMKVGGVVVGYTKRVRFWDKNAALEKAMKHLGLFGKDNKQKPTAVIVALMDAVGKNAGKFAVKP